MDHWACEPSFTEQLLSTYSAFGPTLVTTLQTIFTAQCLLLTYKQWPPDRTTQVLEDPHFDFVIIGAGSAGSVIANRLTENPEWKVLLVEAGGYPTLATETPLAFFNNLQKPEDWQYKTTRQKNACLSSKNKQCYWPRGKVLGGCSSINGMFYIRGNRDDYNEWASFGDKSWSYEDCLKYFKKSENITTNQDSTIDRTYHGVDGYLNVELQRSMDKFEIAMLNANIELGLKEVIEPNGIEQVGVSKSFTTTKGGRRMSTARAFLKPAKDRNNLYLMKNTLATKLIINNNKTEGVTLYKNDKEFNVYIDKEVILSAGSINTPQLLMLSGIGPLEHLQSLGIDVISNLQVGQNLQDHLYVPIIFKMPYEPVLLDEYVRIIVEYITNQTGIFSDVTSMRVLDFINTSSNESNIPNIQHHFLALPPRFLKHYIRIINLHDFNDSIVNQLQELNEEHFLIYSIAILLRPKSKGSIKLKNRKPTEHPLIDANYFNEQDDLDTIVKGLKHLMKLESTENFKKLNLTLEFLKIADCDNYTRLSDVYLQCWSKHMTTTTYHPTGTAKMGPRSDPGAVVDSELQVYGVDGLRVIDASIMPVIVRGNTNAPTIMIGEKGADLIKSFWIKDL